jgi:hypothetical protein
MPAKQAEILTGPTKRHSGPISQGKRSLTQSCWMTLTGALVAFRIGAPCAVVGQPSEPGPYRIRGEGASRREAHAVQIPGRSDPYSYLWHLYIGLGDHFNAEKSVVNCLLVDSHVATALLGERSLRANPTRSREHRIHNFLGSSIPPGFVGASS